TPIRRPMPRHRTAYLKPKPVKPHRKPPSIPLISRRGTLPNAMPLLPRADAYDQSQRKARAVLSFLRVPLYSTVPILAQVMGVKHRPTIHTTLVRMENAGLIRRATLPYGLSGITLWGITY